MTTSTPQQASQVLAEIKRANARLVRIETRQARMMQYLGIAPQREDDTNFKEVI